MEETTTKKRKTSDSVLALGISGAVIALIVIGLVVGKSFTGSKEKEQKPAKRSAKTQPPPEARKPHKISADRRKGRRDSRQAVRPPMIPLQQRAARLLGRQVNTPKGPAEKILLRDLDGDGISEILLSRHDGLWILNNLGVPLAEGEAFGHPNAMEVGDSDGDGKLELVVGWGKGRFSRDKPMKVVLYRLDKLEAHKKSASRSTSPATRLLKLPHEVLLSSQGVRPAATMIHIGLWGTRRGILVGHFADKYNVQHVFFQRQGGKWVEERLSLIRMATTFGVGKLRKSTPELVVGRPYGDTQPGKGDAFLWDGKSERVPIRITGGVMTVTVADLDKDGMDEVVFGDGWDRNYGKVARALVTLARWKNGSFATELLGELSGQFMVKKIVVSDLDGDGKPELLANGSSRLALLRKDATGKWIVRQVIPDNTRDFDVGDLDGKGKPTIVVLLHGGGVALQQLSIGP